MISLADDGGKVTPRRRRRSAVADARGAKVSMLRLISSTLLGHRLRAPQPADRHHDRDGADHDVRAADQEQTARVPDQRRQQRRQSQAHDRVADEEDRNDERDQRDLPAVTLDVGDQLETRELDVIRQQVAEPIGGLLDER